MTSTHQHLMNTNYHQTQAPATSRLLEGTDISERGYFVDATWLKEQLDYHSDDIILIDVTRGAGNYNLDANRSAEDYLRGHIPGAIHLNTDELGEFKDYFYEAEVMRDVFMSKGITCQSTVVFYSIYARDIMYIASRMAFAAYYLGVDNVKILDGGIQAWTRQGYALETREAEPVPVRDFLCTVPKREAMLIKTPDDLLDFQEIHPNALWVSVRTWNEYTGLNEGHAWNKGVGDIAGALWAGDEMLANVNGELADSSYYYPQWQEWGITEDREIVLYCGTSWRSSTMFFLMKDLGYNRLYLYDGSWYKWYLAHEENPAKYPIQRGNPRNKETYEIIREHHV